MLKQVAAVLALVLLPWCGTSAAICDRPPHGKEVECVNPADTSPDLPSSDRLDFVMYQTGSPRGAKLFLWINGTQKHLPPGPAGANVKPLHVAVNNGYRAISVPYNNQTAVINICPNDPDRDCSAKVRQHRLYEGPRSIEHRVVRLLEYLDRRHPNMHWADYLDAGHPRWSAITVSGQSQGAGMAAFIAKDHLFDRVVLFSSPWDFQRRQNGWVLAPWLFNPSKTPPGRWYGGYHVREFAADKMAKAYPALGIPESHIRRFDLDLDPVTRSKVSGRDAGKKFHGQGIGNPAYRADWLFFLGVDRSHAEEPPTLTVDDEDDDDDG